MAGGYNKVILLGNLTRDAELTYAKSGVAICKFDIAVNTTSGAGADRKEDTLFIRIVTFNKQAENCGQYLKKGSQVMVDGRLSTSTWEGDDGQKRYRTEVIAQAVQFLGKPSGQGGSYGSGDDGQVDISRVEEMGISDDEMPF